MFARSSPLEMGPRAQPERQLAAVVGFLEDAELDELLTLAVDRFLVPLPRVTISLPAGPNAHQVDGRLASRYCWMLGVLEVSTSRFANDDVQSVTRFSGRLLRASRTRHRRTRRASARRRSGGRSCAGSA